MLTEQFFIGLVTNLINTHFDKICKGGFGTVLYHIEYIVYRIKSLVR